MLFKVLLQEGTFTILIKEIDNVVEDFQAHSPQYGRTPLMPEFLMSNGAVF